MTLKVKMASCITMFMLALAMLVVGIYAASVQTIRLNGTVNFDITDKSLYVQDVRLQENENTTPQSLKASGKFMAGYINLNFNMNLGTFTNSYGSFALYFDIINTSDLTYSVEASTTQSGVTVTATVDNESNVIPVGTVTPEQITPETELSASVKLTVTAPTVNEVELNKITVTINEVILPTTITALSSNSSLGQAQGNSAFVGEEVTLTANFIGFQDGDFLGWRVNDENGKLVSTLSEYTFTLQEDSPTTYVAVFEEENAGISYTYDSPSQGQASISNNGVREEALTNGALQIPTLICRRERVYTVTSIADTDAGMADYTPFYNVNSTLTSLILPETLNRIGDWSLLNCMNLINVIIPESVTYIGLGAFQNCMNLTSVIIPDNVNTIGNQAFLNCKSLTNITIPDNVTVINDNTFWGCDNLTRVTIGSGVTYIGSGAFGNCYYITIFEINAVEPPTLILYEGDELFAEKIYVPAESVEAYKSSTYWLDYADRIFAIE